MQMKSVCSIVKECCSKASFNNPDFTDFPDFSADPVHGLQLGTSPTRAGGQDDVRLNKLPQTIVKRTKTNATNQTSMDTTKAC